MTKSAFVLATTKHDCPRCGVPAGIFCSTPSGRQMMKPHGARVNLLTKEEWNLCGIPNIPGEGILKAAATTNVESLRGIWKDLPKEADDQIMGIPSLADHSSEDMFRELARRCEGENIIHVLDVRDKSLRSYHHNWADRIRKVMDSPRIKKPESSI